MADNSGRRRQRGEAKSAWLDRLRNTNSAADNTNEFFRLMQDAKEFDVAAIGFRHASVATQKRQDRILEDYRLFVRFFKEIADDVTEKELDEICFPSPTEGEQPENFDGLWLLLRPYIYFVAEDKIPRSNAHTIISYTTLIQYRESLQFWVPRKYNERGIKPPMGRHVFNKMTELLRKLAVEKKLIRFNSGPGGKVSIGLDDIRQLIDMDVKETMSIELSEQHHFALCLGRTCALRPGALGPSVNDKFQADRVTEELPYLAWKDCNLQRGSEKGMWTLQLTIRNLKTNKEMDAEGAVRNKTMQFRLSSPQQQSNLALSVPHRLLVIGLRRGVFEGLSTIDDLFDSELNRISIKDEFRDRPVLLAGKQRGLGLQDDHTPLPANSLTSIRRLSAGAYVKALGVDHARILMSHEPDTRTLERFYVDRTSITDVSAITLGEEVGSGKADEFMQLEITSGVTLDRLPAEKIIETYGPELNALFRQYIRADENYAMLSRKEKKNRDRVLRRKAFLVLRREIVSLYRKKQTTAERTMRKEELLGRATLFNKKLVEAYAEEDGHDNNEDVANLDSVDFDLEFEQSTEDVEEGGTEVVHDVEEDAEDMEGAVRDREITVPEELQFTDAAINYVEAAAAIPYEVAAKLAMRLMLFHEEGQYQRQGDVSCSQCQQDDTVSEDKKAKTYTVGHLREHVASDFHTPYKQWIRRAHNNRDGRSYYCPYCMQVHPEGDSTSFSQLKFLVRHIGRCNLDRIADASDWTTPEFAKKHEELKKADGWYDDDWEVNRSTDVQRGTSRRAKTVLAARKTRAKKKLPEPIPIAGYPGLLWAAPGQIKEKAGNGVIFASAPGEFGFKPTNPKSSGPYPGVVFGPTPDEPGFRPTYPKSGGLYPGTIFVPFPGTEDNMPGDGYLMSDWVKGVEPSGLAIALAAHRGL
ncbi:hypothetical protein CCUS01_17220 [Colletotrichum cuscutae]|uniref:Uncharacterized protein n=1 Tax=Colletotrichum cuscutae TaxID=1209917 RepID=A0AAI9V6K9_9PEZI|nr:hypothetical protein CCUS01_17220 [Colletotrichum cuscutae]